MEQFFKKVNLKAAPLGLEPRKCGFKGRWVYQFPQRAFKLKFYHQKK